MNAIIPVHPPAALWDRYVSLLPNLKLLLRLKCLLVPAVTKSDFVECLKAAGSRAPDGKAWTVASVSNWCDELRRPGLLTADDACPPELLCQVAADAVACEDATALITAVRKLFPVRTRSLYSYGYSDTTQRDAMCRLIRLAVFTNDAADFIANRDLCDQAFGPGTTLRFLDARFSGVPLETDWIASRHPAIQAPLLKARLDAFVVTGQAGPDMPETIALARKQQGLTGFGEIRTQLLRCDLLAGRVDSLRAASTATGSNTSETRQALEGALAFLEGRNDAAIMLYRDALKLRRKRLGRRKLFLEDEHGVLFLMALLRANDASAAREIQTGLDIALFEFEAPRGRRPAGCIGRCRRCSGWSRGSMRRRANCCRAAQGDAAEPFSAACVALAEYAVDPDLAREQRRPTLPPASSNCATCCR